MKRFGAARVLTAVFLGVLFGAYKHAMQVRWAGLGRAAFLADQNAQFDKGMNPPHGTLVSLVAGVILLAVAAGMYELIVAGVAQVLPPARHEE